MISEAGPRADARRSLMRFMGRLKVVVAIGVVFVIVAGLASLSADASQAKVKYATQLRVCPPGVNAWCTTKAQLRDLAPGTATDLICWVDDVSPFGPRSSPRYFYARLKDGGEGYIWTPDIQHPQPRTPSCAGNPNLRASNYALSHVGEWQLKNMVEAHANGWGAADWANEGDPTGVNYYWSEECVKLAWLAGDAAGRHIFDGNAIDIANHYLPSLKKTSPVPRGALVFWKDVRDSHGIDFGHVGIAIGKVPSGRAANLTDMFVGTQGFGRPERQVAAKPISDGPGTYMGWILMSDISDAPAVQGVHTFNDAIPAPQPIEPVAPLPAPVIQPIPTLAPVAPAPVASAPPAKAPPVQPTAAEPTATSAPPDPTPAPTRTLVYDNYGNGSDIVGHPICRGNPRNQNSMPGGSATEMFYFPSGAAAIDHAKLAIDPDASVTAHLTISVNDQPEARADAVANGDTEFSFSPVHVVSGDWIQVNVTFTATSGSVITVYTVGNPGGNFWTSNRCSAVATNANTSSAGLKAVVSGWR